MAVKREKHLCYFTDYCKGAIVNVGKPRKLDFNNTSALLSSVGIWVCASQSIEAKVFSSGKNEKEESWKEEMEGCSLSVKFQS